MTDYEMLGRCTLWLGDCLEEMSRIEDSSIDLLITSPFYNCRKVYGSFDDQMPWPDYYDFMGKFLNQAYRVLRLGGVIAVNVPGVIRWQAEHRHADTWGDFESDYKTHRNGQNVTGKGRIEPIGFTLFEMMRQRDAHIREPIIWIKGDDGNAISGDYRTGCDSDPYLRPAHELILLGSKGRWFHRGGTGRRGTGAVPLSDVTKDVWFITPVSSPLHPAIFPEEIPARLIRLFIHAADAVVCDPFMGLGNTGMAARKAGLQFIGIEKDLSYFEIASRRLANVARELRGEWKPMNGNGAKLTDLPMFAEVA